MEWATQEIKKEKTTAFISKFILKTEVGLYCHPKMKAGEASGCC